MHVADSHCELNGSDPFDYLNQLQRHAEELKLNTVGVDALELPRDAGADGRPLRCGIRYAKSCVAERDSIRPWLGEKPKCSENGLLQRQNPIAFLTRHAGHGKCFLALADF